MSTSFLVKYPFKLIINFLLIERLVFTYSIGLFGTVKMEQVIEVNKRLNKNTADAKSSCISRTSSQVDFHAFGNVCLRCWCETNIFFKFWKIWNKAQCKTASNKPFYCLLFKQWMFMSAMVTIFLHGKNSIQAIAELNSII